MDALCAPHIGDRSEAELIEAFTDKIGELSPQLVSFNGQSFDLPVLRYRAMVNRVSAGGLESRRYFYRYGNDSLDLCDALASYGSSTKMKLDDLCKIMHLPGKPVGVDGSKVEGMVEVGKIEEVAAYCESDVVNTYRLWLLHELFTAGITKSEHGWSEKQLETFINAHKNNKPHLASLL